MLYFFTPTTTKKRTTCNLVCIYQLKLLTGIFMLRNHIPYFLHCLVRYLRKGQKKIKETKAKF